ncbi:MAG TPA: MoaD/ThiS family protein [Chthoniobacteraceae bacterium]|jgi:molybdopterin converting factor small subunit|nr:moaD [Chthoniobacter sp.]HEV7869165.1 MoaD/ThiS family protein [Chthoniobacteraceae bacterium]
MTHFDPIVQIQLLAFAQTAQQLGFREQSCEFSPDESPRRLLARLVPALEISGLRVAVDCEYHDWDAPIGAASEIALIPPVSGG